MASAAEKDRQRLKDFRLLSNLAKEQGISVRREKLSRGHSYRVKSGECVFGGENLVFVDQRLPSEQQLSILVDYLLDSDFQLDTQLASNLSELTRKLFPSLLQAETETQAA